MKLSTLPLLFLLALGTSCGRGNVTHGDLKIELDKRMYWRVGSIAEGVAPFCGDFTPTGTFEAAEATISDFAIKELRQTEGGGNLRPRNP